MTWTACWRLWGEKFALTCDLVWKKGRLDLRDLTVLKGALSDPSLVSRMAMRSDIGIRAPSWVNSPQMSLRRPTQPRPSPLATHADTFALRRFESALHMRAKAWAVAAPPPPPAFWSSTTCRAVFLRACGPSGCGFFTGPSTITHSSLHMLCHVAMLWQPFRLVLQPAKCLVTPPGGGGIGASARAQPLPHPPTPPNPLCPPPTVTCTGT